MKVSEKMGPDRTPVTYPTFVNDAARLDFLRTVWTVRELRPGTPRQILNDLREGEVLYIVNGDVITMRVNDPSMFPPAESNTYYALSAVQDQRMRATEPFTV